MADRDYVIVQKGAKRSPADEWIHCTLADACSAINYGLTASASSRSDGPKFLRITDIVSGSPNWSTVPHVEADDDTIAKYRLHDGDIVMWLRALELETDACPEEAEVLKAAEVVAESGAVVGGGGEEDRDRVVVGVHR